MWTSFFTWINLHNYLWKSYRPGMDGIETDLHASGAVLPLVIAVVLRPISLLLQLPCSHNTVTGHSSSFVTARGQAAASKQQLVELTEIPQVKKQLHSSNGSRGSFFFNNCIVPLGFLLWGIQTAFTQESQLQQSGPTQPTAHAGCFQVCIIHQILTWTAGALTS